MRSFLRPSPVPSKPHLSKDSLHGWMAKFPARYGALRGFGEGPVDAYRSLLESYAQWKGYRSR